MKINNFEYVQIAFRRAGYPVETAADILAVVTRRYADVRSSTQVAREFRISAPTVRNWLRKAGVPLQPRGGVRMIGQPVTLCGQTKRWRDWFPPQDWSQRERCVLYTRIVKNGWSLEAALTRPILPRRFSRLRVLRDAQKRQAWNDEENYDN